MKTKSTDIADFYRQISLLLKSGLPLPESIEQLGRNFSKSDFKEVLLKIAEKTSKGKTLTDAMREYPQYFNKLHIQMIEAGEKSGMLPETLSEVARTSHMNLQLASMIRDISLYPIFVIWFTFTIVFTLYIHIVPKFKVIFEEMLEGEPLPWLTEKIMVIGQFLVDFKPLLIIAIIAYPLFFLWFLSGSLSAKRVFMRIVSFIPGTYTIFHNLNMARLCSMWSVLMQQKTPDDKAITITKQIIEDRRIEKALARIATSLQEGIQLSDAFEKEKIISGMIPLTIRHVPEKELPYELMNLAHLFRERASMSSRKFSTTLTIVLIFLSAITVGSVVIAMFMPLISIIRKLGGG